MSTSSPENANAVNPPGPGRVMQFFLNAAHFTALAVFKISSSYGLPQEAVLPVALAMLVFCIIFLAIAFRWEGPGYFDWAITIYFAIISAFLVISPEATEAFFHRYPVTGIYGILFAAAFLPPLLGMDPFTYKFAKKRAPREFWDHPYFIQINRIITYAWSLIFFISLVVSLYPSMVTRVVIPLAIILGIGYPFTKRFPSYYLKRKGVQRNF